MAYIANMDEAWKEKLRQVEWVVATGENDSLVRAEPRRSRRFSSARDSSVQAEFWPGVFGHDWPFWKEHIRRFI